MRYSQGKLILCDCGAWVEMFSESRDSYNLEGACLECGRVWCMDYGSTFECTPEPEDGREQVRLPLYMQSERL